MNGIEEGGSDGRVDFARATADRLIKNNIEKKKAERKARIDRIVASNYNKWNTALNELDTTTDTTRFSEVLSFLEKTITDEGSKKQYKAEDVDRIKSAIAANRQRELILRSSSNAGSKQYAFDTILNKQNIFNK